MCNLLLFFPVQSLKIVLFTVSKTDMQMIKNKNMRQTASNDVLVHLKQNEMNESAEMLMNDLIQINKLK